MCTVRYRKAHVCRSTSYVVHVGIMLILCGEGCIKFIFSFSWMQARLDL